jgi:beta-galactosidase
VDDVLAAGASLNLYLANGGTSFGLWNGANVVDGEYRATVTSYDYGAAIGEAGELTDTFHAVREVIRRHTGVDPPAPPPAPDRLPPARAAVEHWGGLLDNASEFGRSVVAPTPLTLEELGVDHGLVLYRSEVLVPPDGGELRLEGLADRAVVLADGAALGVVDRNEPGAALSLDRRPDGRATALDVLVENQGRVNYGHDLGERKGVRGVRLGRRFVHGWESIALPLDADGLVDRFRLDDDEPPEHAPALAQATFDVGQPADGFLALPGWTKGFVWLNGFLLGRYWAVGPQRTLYAPAPLWRGGPNVVTVLELHEPGSVVELRDEPDLGETTTT